MATVLETWRGRHPPAPAGGATAGAWRSRDAPWASLACTKRVGAVRFGALLLCYPRYRAASPHGEDTACARELRAAGRRWVGGRRRGALRPASSRSGDGGAARRARCAVRRQRVRRQGSTACVGWVVLVLRRPIDWRGNDGGYDRLQLLQALRPRHRAVPGLPRQLLLLQGEWVRARALRRRRRRVR